VKLQVDITASTHAHLLVALRIIYDDIRLEESVGDRFYGENGFSGGYEILDSQPAE
jgi:predicted DNA-binding transcriptional regulator YafY